MTTSSYFAAVALVLFAALPALAQDYPPPAKQGYTLLMNDLRILEGDFERTPEGDYRRGTVGKDAVVIPAKQVKFAAESRDVVRKFLLAQGEAKARQPGQGNGLYNTEAAKAFTTSILPILVNRCASCHTKPGAGNWLMKEIRLGTVDAEASRINLLETFLLLDRTQPSNSKLIHYALTAHGGQKAPAFGKRDHPAVHRLECWAYGMALPEGSPIPDGVPRLLALPAAVFIAKPVAVPPPVKPSPPADPFDPKLFNRIPPPAGG